MSIRATKPIFIGAVETITKNIPAFSIIYTYGGAKARA